MPLPPNGLGWGCGEIQVWVYITNEDGPSTIGARALARVRINHPLDFMSATAITLEETGVPKLHVTLLLGNVISSKIRLYGKRETETNVYYMYIDMCMTYYVH